MQLTDRRRQPLLLWLGLTVGGILVVGLAISALWAPARLALEVSRLRDAPSLETKVSIAEGLGKTTEGQAYLAELLRDPDEDVRLAVALGLKSSGDLSPVIRAELWQRLHDSSTDVRIGAVEALADHTEVRAKADLVATLISSVDMASGHSLARLARIGCALERFDADLVTRTLLVQMLNSSDKLVAEISQLFGYMRFELSLSSLPNRALAPAVVGRLMHLLDHPVAGCRGYAALALRHFGRLARPAIPLLRRNLRDKSAAVRWQSAAALWVHADTFDPDFRRELRKQLRQAPRDKTPRHGE